MFFLESQQVVKRYAAHLSLDQVSISVPENSIFGLLGPNGAGKTTLIRIINQIPGPDEGQILLKGHPLAPEDIARIGYLPEERGLYKKMKVGEQALYLARLKGMSRPAALTGTSPKYNTLRPDRVRCAPIRRQLGGFCVGFHL